ncbi:MAG TPA: hypothetical protein PLO29_08220 [Paludibacter sp.]|jgi:hypothetical protein|nr:hypothetical protein [Paludibacter sp.]
MFKAFIVSAILLFIGILLLGVRVFFVKNGTFPNFHVGGNKALKKRGINCATSQDREAQKKSIKPSTVKTADDMLQNF